MASLVFHEKFNMWDVVILIITLLVGLWVRLDNLFAWQDFADAVFINGKPLLTNFDGYYYLRLARDIIENSYSVHDVYRAVPDYATNSVPPPLISVILARLSLILPFSLEWIAVILPAVLGALVALPLFGIGWIFGGRVCAYTAALLGVVSHDLVFRTQLGWLDTDCLNVFFPLAITYCVLAFSIENEKKRYMYLCCTAILYVLFYYWWDQATQVVTVLTLFPLIVSLIFFYRPLFPEQYIFYSIIVTSALFFLWLIGVEGILIIFRRIISLFQYVSKENMGYFPNVGFTIAEQGPAGLVETVEATTDSIMVFIFSATGLAIICLRTPGKALFLVPYIALGVTAVFYANRFIIFFTPAITIGLGVFFSQLWQTKTLRLLIRCAVVIVAGISCLGSVYREFTDNFLPQMRPELIAGMEKISKITTKESIIWAWWNYGYALNYHARRATINDGSVHSGERTVYNALPLATSSYKLAANFMQFYVIEGVKGLNEWYRAVGNTSKGYLSAIKILEDGPTLCEQNVSYVNISKDGNKSASQWCSFFFPRSDKPVYLFVNDHLRWSKEWFWQGTWDVEKRKGVLVAKDKGFGKGRDGKKSGLVVNVGWADTDSQKAARLFEHSVFNNLFVKKEFSNGYFIPIKVDSFVYQVWEVRGDKMSTE
ncbi:dolichyl-diphosphooligosaccharide--protein glycosyltransferase [Desulfopila aestuarii DSM 18488]|uniref:Dolichyl-diphosphooligosaccharide--protein glycosyltransferase n=2 Tax=Desulfopila aestuarii TaxID=231440 RepID=A0A1M7Y1P7_9BACT|nr:dolichyl-diphosphooligosaccharide--protein glycosyltransferase [Desulfopila aestuarii DSM 18488]